MSDNVAITAGAGTTVATDDIGGIHYQLIKLAYGALDTGTIVSTSNGLPVQVIGTPAVSVSGVVSTDDTTHKQAESTVLASASRTTTQTVAISNSYFTGAYICVDVTTAGTGSITPKFQFVDALSSKTLDVLTAAAPITTAVTTWFFLGKVAPPTTVIAANQVAVLQLPKNWNVVITANNANAMTYSVNCLLVL